MNIKRGFSFSIISLLLLNLFSLPVSAVIAEDAEPPKIDGDKVVEWINTGLDFITAAVYIGVVVMGVLGAYMWMTSAGDPGKIKQAQGTLTWAIIGLVFFLIIKMLLTYFFVFLTT
jgi:hypothetical protein